MYIDSIREVFTSRKKALYVDEGVELEYIVIDATECPVQRPKKAIPMLQWKEKHHTVKGQIVIDTNQRIICTHTSVNNIHDFKLFKQSRLPIQKETKARVNNGYLGINAIHANCELLNLICVLVNSDRKFCV